MSKKIGNGGHFSSLTNHYHWISQSLTTAFNKAGHSFNHCKDRSRASSDDFQQTDTRTCLKSVPLEMLPNQFTGLKGRRKQGFKVYYLPSKNRFHQTAWGQWQSNAGTEYSRFWGSVCSWPRWSCPASDPGSSATCGPRSWPLLCRSAVKPVAIANHFKFVNATNSHVGSVFGLSKNPFDFFKSAEWFQGYKKNCVENSAQHWKSA